MKNSECKQSQIGTDATAQSEARTALYAAIAEAQSVLHGVEKSSRNDYHKYKYASAEDMMQAATEAMGPNGLALICTGHTLADGMVTASYVLTHREGGSMTLGPYSITAHPDKARPMDKAISTALTYLQAYTLRGVFNIPRVEEGSERDSTDDQRIQAYRSGLGKLQKEKDDLGKKLFSEMQDFFKAAGLDPRNRQQREGFIAWASGDDEYAKTDAEKIVQIKLARRYCSEWHGMEEVEALSEAQRFRVDFMGLDDIEKARTDAAFEASQGGE